MFLQTSVCHSVGLGSGEHYILHGIGHMLGVPLPSFHRYQTRPGDLPPLVTLMVITEDLFTLVGFWDIPPPPGVISGGDHCNWKHYDFQAGSMHPTAMLSCWYGAYSSSARPKERLGPARCCENSVIVLVVLVGSISSAIFVSLWPPLAPTFQPVLGV